MVCMTDLVVERPAHRALPSGPGKGPGGALLPLWSGRNRCPVIGCDEPIDPSRLMCRRDWHLVPYEIRGRICASWRSGEAAFSSEHQGAVHEAIAFAQVGRSAFGKAARASRPYAGVRFREAWHRSYGLVRGASPACCLAPQAAQLCTVLVGLPNPAEVHDLAQRA
jgi:hypothetical protein